MRATMTTSSTTSTSNLNSSSTTAPITVASLNWYWKDKGSLGVTSFYSKQTKLECFSNFHQHAPIDFKIPESCWKFASFANDRNQTSKVEFSEKSIMLTKAAMMDDVTTFDKILKSESPKEVKALGRQVSPWLDHRWNDHLLEVACEVVEQKFAQLPTERKQLKSTGHTIIAEAATRDDVWGIGLGVKDARTNDPKQWRGKNILGYALMHARSKLCPPHVQVLQTRIRSPQQASWQKERARLLEKNELAKTKVDAMIMRFKAQHHHQRQQQHQKTVTTTSSTVTNGKGNTKAQPEPNTNMKTWIYSDPWV